MKLLTKEELKGIDSTSATVTKWDNLFKQALPNMGYTQELIDNMYPYERGIPKKDGTYIPFSPLTGRTFFRMSWADKLCGVLSAISCGNTSVCTMRDLGKLVLDIATGSKDTFDKFFPEHKDIEEIHDLTTEQKRKLIAEFINNSDIVIYSIHNGGHSSSSLSKVSAETKEALIQGYVEGRTRSNSLRQGDCLFVYYKPLEDIYDSFPNISFTEQSDNTISRLRAFSEVYLQDYLVVSANPVDKFMCSTKQAFSSCMSLAKQDDRRGTSSMPAFGLPTLFPSDSTLLVFLTPGKHKNMYWEESEWQKDGENRDKEKAYKYLKMTCRALTYQGYISRLAKNVIQNNKDTIPKEVLDSMHVDRPRLFVGRQYSARGEDRVWQPMIEYLLGRQGIATSHAYAEEIENFISTLARIGRAGVSRNGLVQEGELIDDKAIAVDKYGYLRGIYYDNLKWAFNPGCLNPGGLIKAGVSLLKDGETAHITVGTSRYGSGGVTHFSARPGLDAFKIITGEQKYDFINSSVKICAECGEFLPRDISADIKGLKDERGCISYYCNSCVEKLGIVKCEACGELHLAKNANRHKIFNLNELLHPDTYKDMPEKKICRSMLRQVESTQTDPPRKFLCLHCGNIEDTYTAYGGMSSLYIIDFHGISIATSICSNCMHKAVMCDKCKRIIFMDTLQDAALLLPNKRVICPDCIPTIRMRQAIRENMEHLIQYLSEEDLLPESDPGRIQKDDSAFVEKAMEVVYSRPGFYKERVGELLSAGSEQGRVLKNIFKQVASYLKAHPDKKFPDVRWSGNTDTPIPFGLKDASELEEAAV